MADVPTQNLASTKQPSRSYDSAKPERPFTGRKSAPDANKIMVVGFPEKVATKDLEKLCSPFGHVTRAEVAINKETGVSRRFGFVSFGNPSSCALAIEKLNSSIYEGRTLNVRAVEDRSADKRPSARPQGRPCFNFARGKCKKGEGCKFLHDAETVVVVKKPKNTTAASSIPAGYCVKFQVNKCHRGKACKWKHEIYRPMVGPAAGQLSVNPSRTGGAAIGADDDEDDDDKDEAVSLGVPSQKAASPRAVKAASPRAVKPASPSAVTAAFPSATGGGASEDEDTDDELERMKLEAKQLEKKGQTARSKIVKVASPSAAKAASPRAVKVASPSATGASAPEDEDTDDELERMKREAKQLEKKGQTARSKIVKVASPSAVKAASPRAVKAASPSAVKVASPNATGASAPEDEDTDDELERMKREAEVLEKRGQTARSKTISTGIAGGEAAIRKKKRKTAGPAAAADGAIRPFKKKKARAVVGSAGASTIDGTVSAVSLPRADALVRTSSGGAKKKKKPAT